VKHLHVEIKVSLVLMNFLVLFKITVLIIESIKHSLPSVSTQPQMIANVLMSTEFAQRIPKKKKNVSEKQLICRWTCSMTLKLGTIEASLASCAKVIATCLRYEK